MASKDGDQPTHDPSSTSNPVQTTALPDGDDSPEQVRQAAKSAQTSATTAVTKKRNDLTALMSDEDNLHLVKDGLVEYVEKYNAYEEVHKRHMTLLVTKEDHLRETERHDQKYAGYLLFCCAVDEWIQKTEAALSDKLDSKSRASKSSRSSRSSKKSNRSATSLASAQAKEAAKLAALKIEKEMQQKFQVLTIEKQNLDMKQHVEKQKLDMKQQALEIDMKIAKAEAKGKVYAALSEHQDGGDGMNAYFKANEGNKAPQLPSQSKAKPTVAGNNAPKNQLFYTSEVGTAGKKAMDSTLDPDATVFDMSTSQQLGSGIAHTPIEEQVKLASLQQTHFELVNTSKQIAAAMLLPSPEIPKFDGDPLEFRAFVIAFNARITDRTAGHADRLYYLNQYLTGEAKELIGGCLHMDTEAGFTEAWRLLEKEFGDPYKVSITYLNKIFSFQQIKYDDTAALKCFAAFLSKCCNAMNTCNDLSALNHPPNMQAIVQKLPSYLQSKWRDHVMRLKSSEQSRAGFLDLVQFVGRASEAASDPVYGLEAMRRFERVGYGSASKGQEKSTVNNFSIGADPKDENMVKTSICVMCRDWHDIEDCKAFKGMSLSDRRDFVKKAGRCYACYGENHISKFCMNRRTCETCGKKHPTRLHDADFLVSHPVTNNAIETNEAERYEDTEINCNNLLPVNMVGASNCDPSVILQAILPVLVSHRDSPNHFVRTYAFYDTGSSGCFMTDELQEDLHITGEKTTLRLRTMHGMSYSSTTAVAGLLVADRHGENSVVLPRTFSRSEIPVSKRQIPRPEVVSRWEHLRGVAKLMAPFQENVNVGLLIGSNCPQAIEPLSVVSAAGPGPPFATLLRHGWTVCGPVEITVNNNEVTSNRIAVQEVEVFKEMLTNMFETDFISDKRKRPDERGLSLEDEIFMAKIERETIFQDGNYTIPLPFRQTNLRMPNNREQATKRANWQRRKMQRDPNYHKEYTTFITKMLDNGYAMRVPADRLTAPTGELWFLPHHGVYHPQKRKLRVVFDCAAQFGGTSLNAQLLQGPNLTNALTGVLTRFREEEVAFMADIESMFYRVNVPVSQQNFLRFLWWPEGDIRGDLHEYCMTVHIFGAVSSPSIANYALRRTTRDFGGNHTPSVTSTILRNFYVDDCLRSSPNVVTAEELLKGVVEVCKAGGFRLTKVTSNNRQLLNAVPPDERSGPLQTKNLVYDDMPIERALGVYWHIQSDTFGFSIDIKSRPLTRRGLLATVSSVYDPLGFLAPVILPAKRLLQELCKEQSLDWDDPIPAEYLPRWRAWLDALPTLNGLFVNRCLRMSELATDEVAEIHVFSDASMTGYGSVAYLRIRKPNGNYSMNFLMGKARVSPLNRTSTIPRLELTAAVTSVELAASLQEEFDRETRVYYHTDSTTVLRYISNEQRRFPIFVANRVRTIREFSSPAQWKYVRTTNNPADDGSRGLDPATFMTNRRWLNGPEFLCNGSSDWMDNVIPLDEAEMETCAVVAACQEPVECKESSSTVTKFVERYSSWYRLKRAAAILRRFFMTLQERINAATRNLQTHEIARYRQPLTTKEIQDSEAAILRFVQSQVYDNEIRELAVNGTHDDSTAGPVPRVKKASSLYKLDPFMEDGLIRVGGRLSRSSLLHETKHPIILPKRGHVTTLIVRSVHEVLAHAGRNHVLAELREKYWVICSNSAVRRVLHQCITCRRLRGPTQEQKMADLQEQRTDVSPPFTHTGVDYFGPFLIKEGRKEMKRYGVVFTCMASRGIHIESANTLETDSFIHALRRFVARRGYVAHIYSDNGTNLVGAQRELKQALLEMDQSTIHNEMLRIGINWTFNPPAASHFGGVWERMIRTIRKVLNPLLKEFGTRLNDESLRTLLCEVEAIINSRPLTTISDDVNDLQPLTPSHILTMKSRLTTPPPGTFQATDMYARRCWRRVQHLSNVFWSRWKREYLVTLQQRPKWNEPRRNQRPGDVVLVKDDAAPRNSWSLAIIEETENDCHGVVRAVKLRTASTRLRRPINKLVLLVPNDAQTTDD